MEMSSDYKTIGTRTHRLRIDPPKGKSVTHDDAEEELELACKNLYGQLQNLRKITTELHHAYYRP